MKFVILACLMAVATCSPLPQQEVQVLRSEIQPADGVNFLYEKQEVQVLRSEIQPADGANFQYEIELDNGYQETRVGTTGEEGQSIMSGSFSIPLEDGSVAIYTYVADEAGYRVERTQ